MTRGFRIDVPASSRRIRNRRLRRQQERELKRYGEVRTVYVRDIRGWF